MSCHRPSQVRSAALRSAASEFGESLRDGVEPWSPVSPRGILRSRTRPYHRRPSASLGSRQPCGSSPQPSRDHECRIEADAELADETHILAGVTGELVEESGRPGPRDRAEIIYELLAIHPDAVIDHRQSPSRLVRNEDD